MLSLLMYIFFEPKSNNVVSIVKIVFTDWLLILQGRLSSKLANAKGILRMISKNEIAEIIIKLYPLSVAIIALKISNEIMQNII